MKPRHILNTGHGSVRCRCLDPMTKLVLVSFTLAAIVLYIFSTSQSKNLELAEAQDKIVTAAPAEAPVVAPLDILRLRESIFIATPFSRRTNENRQRDLDPEFPKIFSANDPDDPAFQKLAGLAANEFDRNDRGDGLSDTGVTRNVVNLKFFKKF